jgi:hypothetical protein
VLGIVIEDKVYDCTTFADQHPGGESMIYQFAGKSCTWQVSPRIRIIADSWESDDPFTVLEVPQ